MKHRPALVLLLLALPLQAGYFILNRLHNFKQFVVEYIAVTLAMSLFYIAACWWASKKHSGGDRFTLAAVLLAGLVFRLTVFPLYPSLTEDPYRYRWQGKLQSAGGNPYRERPEDQRWRGLRDSTWPLVNRKDLPSAYGPLLEWTYRLAYAAVSPLESDELRQVRLFKIPFCLFDLATAAALMAVLNRLSLPPACLLVYFWSPLVVIEFWASGHSDSMLLFFLVLAVWAGLASRWTYAMGALWAAALTKFWPVLLFPVFLLSCRKLSSAIARAAAWLPVVALVSWPYFAGASELRHMLAGFLGGWRNNASLYNWIYSAAGEDYERGKPVVAVILALAVLVIALRRLPLLQGVLWTTLTLLFLSANCFPWYLTWILPWVAIQPQPALLLWTALVPLSYHVLIEYNVTGRWLEDPFYLYLEYVPVYAMLLAGRWVFPRKAAYGLSPLSSSGG